MSMYVFLVGMLECLLLLFMFMSMCIDVKVMSSAYAVSYTGACGTAISDIK